MTKDQLNSYFLKTLALTAVFSTFFIILLLVAAPYQPSKKTSNEKVTPKD